MSRGPSRSPASRSIALLARLEASVAPSAARDALLRQVLKEVELDLFAPSASLPLFEPPAAPDCREGEPPR